jgi:hypothetical protein
MRVDELKLQPDDPRYGEDSAFTDQTNSLKTFTTNLRSRLRDSSNQILIPNNKAMKVFLEEMGIQADYIQDLREDGQMAEAIGSRIVKIAHPLL